MIDRNLQLSENFYLREFIESKAIDKQYYEKIWKSVTPQVINNLEHLCLTALQPARDYYNKPIIVNAGFRPVWYEKLKRRSGKSTHACSEPLVAAADSSIQEIGTLEYFNFFDKKLKWTGGLGYYPAEKFVHVDTLKKPEVRRW